MRALVGLGASHGELALMVKCSPPTLRKWFRHELDIATIAATARFAHTLLQQATTPGNIVDAMFWLKPRAGWRKKQLTPADGPGAAARVVVIRRMFNRIDCKGQASELSPPLIKGDVHDPDR